MLRNGPRAGHPRAHHSLRPRENLSRAVDPVENARRAAKYRTSERAAMACMGVAGTRAIFLMTSIHVTRRRWVNQHGDENEYNDVLSEISSLYLQYDDYDCIVGGDFNCDFVRMDERSVVLRGWAEGLGLQCPALQPGAPRRPTYHTHDARPSLLDYLFMTHNMFDSLVSWNVLDDGDNLSDHNPKIATLRWRQEYIACSTSGNSARKPMWGKASEPQRQAYRVALDKYLSEINIPCGAAVCPNLRNCDKHESDFGQFLNSIISACDKATYECIPVSKGKSSNRGIPGWNEYVRDKRSSSIFWHNQWKETR